MNSVADNDVTEARRLATAAAWRTHLAETGGESSELDAWLAADERNETAWQQVNRPWELFGEQATAPALIEVRRAALGRARKAGRRQRRYGRRTFGKVAAAVAIVAGAAALVTLRLQLPDVYQTELGERRVITLSDGSRLSLDSQTEVRVRYSEEARNLTLLRGQARFDVARDVERPFSVRADGRKIVATGTAFNVDLLGTDMVVTLIEGRIVVLDDEQQRDTGGRGSRAPETRQPVELRAGEQLVVSPTEPPDVVPASIERAIAWQSGRLVFDNELLSIVTARVSRYSTRQVRVTDERAAALRISGVFSTGDIDGFVATVTEYLPVRARRGDGGVIVLDYAE